VNNHPYKINKNLQNKKYKKKNYLININLQFFSNKNFVLNIRLRKYIFKFVFDIFNDVNSNNQIDKSIAIVLLSNSDTQSIICLDDSINFQKFVTPIIICKINLWIFVSIYF
jgi:hypothetical protein